MRAMLALLAVLLVGLCALVMPDDRFYEHRFAEPPATTPDKPVPSAPIICVPAGWDSANGWLWNLSDDTIGFVLSGGVTATDTLAPGDSVQIDSSTAYTNIRFLDADSSTLTFWQQYGTVGTGDAGAFTDSTATWLCILEGSDTTGDYITVEDSSTTVQMDSAGHYGLFKVGWAAPGYDFSPASPPAYRVSGLSTNFATKDTAAPGSDNWPTTWAADGNLYTAWGDGGGFGGTNTTGRVSMGIGRIEGAASAWSGFNVNGGVAPESGDSTWPDVDGQGGKSYGMLALTDSLYAWVSPDNGDENWDWADLYVSLDSGVTWTVAIDSFVTEADSLGIPTFLQVGQGHGTEDSVYAYVLGMQEALLIQTQDPGEIYLTRVARDSIQSETAWEWYQSGGSWGAMGTAYPVFEDSNGIIVTSAVYLSEIDRYLLVTEHDYFGDGALSLWESGDVAGPWNRVEYLPQNGWNSGEDAFYWNFPLKWVQSRSGDSIAAELVYSGINDQDQIHTIEVQILLTVLGEITDLAAAAIDGAAVLSFTSADSADYHRVQYRKTTTFAWTAGDSLDAAAVLDTVSSLENNSTYWFRVLGIRGTDTVWSNEDSVTPLTETADFVEDFSTYDSTAVWDADPRGINTARTGLGSIDTTTYDTGYDRSFKIVYPDRTAFDDPIVFIYGDVRSQWTQDETLYFKNDSSTTAVLDTTWYSGGSTKLKLLLQVGGIPGAGDSIFGVTSGTRDVLDAVGSPQRCTDHGQPASFDLTDTVPEIWIEWRWMTDSIFDTVMPTQGRFTVNRLSAGPFIDEERVNSSRDDAVDIRIKAVNGTDDYNYEFASVGEGSHPYIEVGDTLYGESSADTAVVLTEFVEDWGCSSNPDWKKLFLGTPGGRGEYLINSPPQNHWIQPGPSGGSVDQYTVSGGGNFLDGEWHTYRMHFKQSDCGGANNGEVQFWADGSQLVDSAGILDTAIGCAGTYNYRNISWARNMNQGPYQNQNFWMQWIKIWYTDPGW